MRKVLIGILIILLVVMAYLVIFKGLSFGNFKILSVSQIIEEDDKLTTEIMDTKELIESKYPNENDNLSQSVSKMMTAKNEYLDLANVSTEAEISKASTVETYTVEFLWTVLGRHATAQGVNLNYTPKNNSISFTVTGDYVPILSFISAIENDSRLGFRIENFKLIPNGDNLQATFITRNVSVKTERTTTTVTTQQSSEATKTGDTTKQTTTTTNTNQEKTTSNNSTTEPATETTSQ